MNILDKDYYRQKAPQGFAYQGYWDGLLHYSKRLDMYNNRYIALKPAKNGILFMDIQEKDWVKRKEGVFKSNTEIADFHKSTKYQIVSCTNEQVKNGDLEFMVKHGLTYQPTK